MTDQLLLVLAELLLELIKSPIEAGLHLIITLRKAALKHRQLTAPRFLRLRHLVIVRSHHEKVPQCTILLICKWVPILLFALDDTSVVSDHLQLDLQAEYVLALSDLLIDIAHNRDNHVQKGDLREKGRQDEKAINEHRVLMIVELLTTLEFA